MDQLNVSKMPPQDQRQNGTVANTKDLAIKTPVSVLQELLQLYGTEADYKQLQKEDAIDQAMFYFEVFAKLKDAIYTAKGAGCTKDEAKHAAAKAFLDQLFNGMVKAKIKNTIHTAGHFKNKQAVPTASLDKLSADQVAIKHTDKAKESNENGDKTNLDDSQSKIQIDLPHKTPMYQLNDHLTQYGITPEFELLQTDGTQNNPIFHYQVLIGYKDKQIAAMGTGKSKKQAMQDSARALLHKLSAGDLPDIAIMPTVGSSSSADHGNERKFQKTNEIDVQSNMVVGKAFSATVCIDTNDNTKTGNEKRSEVETSHKIQLNRPQLTSVYQLNEFLKPYGITPDFKLMKPEAAQHNPTFNYQVSIGYNDKQITATGAGTSMRQAMQDSARALLDKLFAGELHNVASAAAVGKGSIANTGKQSESKKNRANVLGNGCSEGTADHNITGNNDYTNAGDDNSKAKIEKLANSEATNLKIKICLAHEMPVNKLNEKLKPYGIKPEFKLLQKEGLQHNPIFHYQVSIDCKDTQLTAMGTGTTKKQAMHVSARVLLDKLSCCELADLVKCSSSVNHDKNNNASDAQANMVVGIEGSSKADKDKLVDGNNNIERIDHNSQMSPINKTPVSRLREQLETYGMSPEFKLLQTKGAQHKPTFHYQVSIIKNNKLVTAMGSGSSKKQAKHASASALLDKLSDDQDKIVDDVTATSMQHQSTDIDKLHLYCTQQALRISFELVEETCEAHSTRFTISCTVLPLNYREIGHGKNKKIAKREAALKMWKRLREPLYLNTEELCLEETVWKQTGLYYQRVEDKVELIEI